MKQTISSLSAIFAIALAPLSALSAPDYPSQPIRMIVPAAAGGAADTIARVIARKIESLGQPVVVDNRAGAAAIVGTSAAAKAPADGYTIVMGFAGGLAINPSLYPDLPYNPQRDFAPISLVAKSPLVVVAHPSLPIKSIGDLVKYAKANPNVLNFASTGSGSTQHLCMELIKSATGIDIVHVPYKGSAPAYIDLISGRIPVMCDNAVSLSKHIDSGKLTALAMTSAERSKSLKSVPTLSESGLKNVEATGWYGLLAPASTALQIISKLNATVRSAVEDAEIQRLFIEQGLIPVATTPEEFGVFIGSEIKKWAKVVKDSGAKVQ